MGNLEELGYTLDEVVYAPKDSSLKRSAEGEVEDAPEAKSQTIDEIFGDPESDSECEGSRSLSENDSDSDIDEALFNVLQELRQEVFEKKFREQCKLVEPSTTERKVACPLPVVLFSTRNRILSSC